MTPRKKKQECVGVYAFYISLRFLFYFAGIRHESVSFLFVVAPCASNFLLYKRLWSMHPSAASNIEEIMYCANK